MPTDLDFKAKVNDDMIIRLLECFVWRNEEKRKRRRSEDGSGSESESGEERFSYVQGKESAIFSSDSEHG
jgi:hypothetical protein